MPKKKRIVIRKGDALIRVTNYALQYKSVTGKPFKSAFCRSQRADDLQAVTTRRRQLQAFGTVSNAMNQCAPRIRTSFPDLL